MAVLIPGLYPEAQTARSLASLKGGGDIPIQIAVNSAINTAINSGLFSCTASMSGYSAAQIQDNMNLLSQMGYTVSLSSTTLTLTW